MCKNLTVSQYRLISKQITSDRNFRISKVCNMDQETEIFKLRGTQNDFWHVEDRGSHIGIRAAKIVTLKPFPSSTNFDPDSRPAQITLQSAWKYLQYKPRINLSLKVAWDGYYYSDGSHMRSITSSVLASKFRLLFSNPPAATTHVNEFSESHSEHKSIEGMRTNPVPRT